MKNLPLFFFLIFFPFWVCGQGELLQSGPMLGYAEMKEVLIWVQTKEAAQVHFDYWETEKPEMVYSTAPYQTQKQEAFTAKCIADQVEPGRSYTYALRINNKLV